jgi:pimeloyl-ACP methyl ester carboxylesterase
MDVCSPLAPTSVYSHFLQQTMGYSNGAMGVTRAAIKAPELFKGLIYLSPITEDDLFSTTEFSTRKERRILFLHGGRDQRIPRSFVQGTAGFLKGSGFDVRLKVYDEEDHYLLFSQPETVLYDVMEWMSEVSQRNPPQATRKTSAAGRRRASPIYVENSACRLQRHPAPW